MRRVAQLAVAALLACGVDGLVARAPMVMHRSPSVRNLAPWMTTRTDDPDISSAAKRAADAGPPQMEPQKVDVGALGRYTFAVLIQMILVGTAFGAIDSYAYGPLRRCGVRGPLPWQAITGIFLALSLRSRVFNPLDNSRPELSADISPEVDAALREKVALSGGKKSKQKELIAECDCARHRV